MSRLGDLVAALCPNGVERKALGDVGTFIRGSGIQKKDLVGAGTPAIHYGQIFTHYGTAAHETKSFVDGTIAQSARKAEHGDLIIATTSENDADVCRAVAWLGPEAAAVSSDAHIYRHTLNPRFAAYFFQSSDFQAQKARHITGTKVRRVHGAGMSAIRIPVPPLAVQSEVVRCLDLMEDMQAELEAELDARRRQYSHYAELLLASPPDVPRVRLGSVATIGRGASPRPIRSFMCPADEGLPWIKIGDVPADGKYITRTAQHVSLAGADRSRRIRPGDFILSNSMSLGRPYISKIEGCIHDGWLALSDYQKFFDSDYLYYLLRSGAIQDEFQRRAGSGTVKNLNADIVKAVEVPIPAMDEQERAVALLNAFDMLVNDPASGLPAEMTARMRQFEYYRDKLLAFPSPRREEAAT
jgi:type I restriction enzyme S subunit